MLLKYSEVCFKESSIMIVRNMIAGDRTQQNTSEMCHSSIFVQISWQGEAATQKVAFDPSINTNQFEVVDN
jgi:hypothetical protein